MHQNYPFKVTLAIIFSGDTNKVERLIMEADKSYPDILFPVTEIGLPPYG